MADFIPDRLPRTATRGEERTYNILKKLPDDYLVYFEPHIGNRRPDFIVIAPDLGVIVIEVKGWHLDDIVSASDTEVITYYDGQQKKVDHPLVQARNYQLKLMRMCARNPKFAQLIHKNGPHEGKFIFPFAHFVVLSNISQTLLKNYNGKDLSTVFRLQNTMTRDVLIDLENASPQEIAAKLKTYFDPYWEIDPLVSEQIDVLRAIIHPEIILSYIPSVSNSVKEREQESLQVLDRKQENNSLKIGEGHRIICGVAGSGKTVLLISRARILHDREPDAQILLLCYNVSLAAYLKRKLKDYPRITVTHFDGWAKMNGVPRYVRDPATGRVEEDESLGNRFYTQLKNRSGDYGKYDAVLVDEAQDFHPSWFSCIILAMKEQLDGDLLIVCDGNQGIRPIGGISWKSIGIKAQGRTIHRALDLDRNYRNTREILQLASHFAIKDAQYNEDSFGIIPVDPYQAQRRGQKPFLVFCKDYAQECQKTVEIVKGLLSGQLPDGSPCQKVLPEEIGILYRKAKPSDKILLNSLIDSISRFAPIIWINENLPSRERVLEEGIKVQTVDSAKGLQYKVVIILWPDAFLPFKSEESALETKRLYVALTRAEDILIITHSIENEFVDIMLASEDVKKC